MCICVVVVFSVVCVFGVRLLSVVCSVFCGSLSVVMLFVFSWLKWFVYLSIVVLLCDFMLVRIFVIDCLIVLFLFVLNVSMVCSVVLKFLFVELSLWMVMDMGVLLW